MRAPKIFYKCFSPVAGIQWVETLAGLGATSQAQCFSPVAGIQWVETPVKHQHHGRLLLVSVPLPGFSGLRPPKSPSTDIKPSSFSPVAGIQWVETANMKTLQERIEAFQSRCRDSVG